MRQILPLTLLPDPLRLRCCLKGPVLRSLIHCRHLARPLLWSIWTLMHLSLGFSYAGSLPRKLYIQVRLTHCGRPSWTFIHPSILLPSRSLNLWNRILHLEYLPGMSSSLCRHPRTFISLSCGWCSRRYPSDLQFLFSTTLRRFLKIINILTPFLRMLSLSLWMVQKW